MADLKLRQEDRKRRFEENERLEDEGRQKQISDYLQSLDDRQRMQLENEAFKNAPRFQRSLITKGGSLGIAARKAAIDNHVLLNIKKGE